MKSILKKTKNTTTNKQFILNAQTKYIPDNFNTNLKSNEIDIWYKLINDNNKYNTNEVTVI